MTDVPPSEVEKLVAEWLKPPDKPNSHYEEGYANGQRRAALKIAAAIQQDKDRAGEAVARVIFTNRKKPDVEWLTDTVSRDTMLYTRPAQPAEVTDAMVERAAIAIHEEWRRGTFRGRWENYFSDYQNRVRAQARAALTAAGVGVDRG